MNQENFKLPKDNLTPQTRTCRVTKDYQAVYPDPITMSSGETLEVSGKEDEGWIWCVNQQGKSGWVPKGYIDQAGNIWRARFDYDAIELSVSTGEVLTVEKAESGWLWCTNSLGKSGWVPAEHVDGL